MESSDQLQTIEDMAKLMYARRLNRQHFSVLVILGHWEVYSLNSIDDRTLVYSLPTRTMSTLNIANVASRANNV